MKTISIRLTAALIVLSFGRAAEASGQEPPALTNVFQQSVAGVSVNNQDIIDGVAMLSHNVGLAVSVEHELGATTSGAAPQPNTFTATIGPGTVSEILDGLCALDPTFAWERDGNMVNVMPRALLSERDYFLNRNVNELVFRDIRDAQEALFKTVSELPPPKEQVAIMEVGVSLAFARPWSATLQNISIREALLTHHTPGEGAFCRRLILPRQGVDTTFDVGLH
jgi:hypothetical protein